MDRRGFLTGLGAGLAGSVLSGARPLSGGVSRAVRPGAGARLPTLSPLGLQLYTVRDLMADDVATILERVAGIGYREVEFAGYHGWEPGELRRLLDDLGLSAPSAHIGFPEPDAFGEALDAAQALGHRHVVVPWIPEERRKSADDYRGVADTLSRMGQRAATREIRVVYHNHAYEFESLHGGSRAPGDPDDGVVPYDLLLERTDPHLVGFQADLYWMRAAGRDPLDYFRRWRGRYLSVHVKDMDARGRMVPVGDGVMDFRTLLAAAREAGVSHYFVEHDRPADPQRAVARSHAHLAGLDLPPTSSR